MSFKFSFKPLVIALVAVSLAGCFGSGKKSRRSRGAAPSAVAATTTRLSGFDLLQRGQHADGTALATTTVPSLKVTTQAGMPTASQYAAFKTCIGSKGHNPGAGATPLQILGSIRHAGAALIDCCRDTFGADALPDQSLQTYRVVGQAAYDSLRGIVVALPQALNEYFNTQIYSYDSVHDYTISPFYLNYGIPKSVLLKHVKAMYASVFLPSWAPSGQLVLGTHYSGPFDPTYGGVPYDAPAGNTVAPTLAVFEAFLNAQPGDTVSAETIFQWYATHFVGLNSWYFIRPLVQQVLAPSYSELLLCQDNAGHDSLLASVQDASTRTMLESIERAVCASNWDDYLVNITNEALSTGYCKIS
mgnify:CR=1 FL=1